MGRLQIGKRAAASIAITVGLVILAPEPAWCERTIYLSSNGDDANAGTQSSTPVRSLMRAQDIAAALVAQSADDIVISIAPGSYDRQRVVWKLAVPDRKIKIVGDVHRPEAVMFDGKRSVATFFSLRLAPGSTSNLTIEGVTVTQYVAAISLAGDRNNPRGYNRGTRILSNRFIDNGGNAHNPPIQSYSILGLVNSKGNVIAHNIFDGMLAPGCGHLHAIYAAHYSSENEIHDNVFRNGCGDAIQVRDASNNNKVYGNEFRNVGRRAAYVEWYCNRAVNRACTKPADECPPVGNKFFDNKIGRGYGGIVIRPTFVYPQPPNPNCGSTPVLAAKHNAITVP